MSPCESVRLELPGYVAGELPPERAAAVDDHVHRCEDCAGELAWVRSAATALSEAPLEARPPAHLAAEVFRSLEVEPVVELVRTAPLEHDPPLHLERLALERAGAMGRTGHWSKLAALTASSLVLALIGLAWLGFGWRNEAREMTERAEQAGVAGVTMTLVNFGGVLPEGAEASARLVRFEDDTLGILLHTRDLPECEEGYRYEVWLEGLKGSVSAGSFQVGDSSGEKTFPLPIGVDPQHYPKIVITREPDDGNPLRTGPALWQAMLDF